MKAEGFIAGRLRFKGRMAVIAIAISFFVMIIAVAISSGFSREIRQGIAGVTGDVTISNNPADLYLDSNPIEDYAEVISTLQIVKGVEKAEPIVYRAGIVKQDGDIYGALFKGSPRDSVSMHVRIPAGLARSIGAEEGDEILCYFFSERMKARRFTIAGIYDSPVETGDNYLIYVPLADMQRLNGWDESQVSAIELTLDSGLRSRSKMKETAALCGFVSGLAATAAVDSYSSVFDWLDLIDYNVYAILLLMTIVAGFNMVSGLLILLFRNISTIGTLKTLGMTDRAIAGTFLRVGARITGTGMLIGNALALLFCLVQGTWHIIRLNPENYFVSFVPVAVDLPAILLADAAAFAVIMLLLLIPSLFISKIDPSVTVSTQ